MKTDDIVIPLNRLISASFQ